MEPRADPGAAVVGASSRVQRIAHGVFRRVARVRRAPAFHPVGVTFAGDAEMDPESGLTQHTGVRAIVRLSRGIGWREPWPDLQGVAIRLVDAHGSGRHQDLLLTSAGSAPIARQVLRPTRRFDTGGFSSILAYRATGRRTLFRCRELAVTQLSRSTDRLPFRVELQMGSPLGTWRDIGSVQVLARAPELDATRFDPWNTGPEITPIGLLNAARRGAYPGSRDGATEIRVPT